MGKEKTTGVVRTELTSKGSRRVNQILEASSAIIAQNGFRALNKRSVASWLSISDGNVSYYFPTKESLWLAVIDHELSEYYRRHHPESDTIDDDPQAAFDDYVSRWIDEYQDPTVRVFFSQIISVAESSSRIASKRDEIYESFTEALLGFSRRLEPDVPAKELERRVLTAIAVLEGLHTVSAFRPTLFADDSRYKLRIVSLVNSIVRGEAS